MNMNMCGRTGSCCVRQRSLGGSDVRSMVGVGARGVATRRKNNKESRHEQEADGRHLLPQTHRATGERELAGSSRVLNGCMHITRLRAP